MHRSQQKQSHSKGFTLIMMLPFILSCLKPLGLNAQSFTTQGTDFWVALMSNTLVTDIDSYYLSACGPRNCSVTISNPNSGWSHTISVNAFGITTYQLPTSECWEMNRFGITNKGLHVVSTDSVQIWVYNHNGTPSSCDATQILSTTSLGTEYIVQSTPVDHCSFLNESRSQFSVLATEDSTIVETTFSSPTANGIAAGTTRYDILNAGQILQVQGPSNSGDFSGTTVTSLNCKRIAVFSGASNTSIPDPGGSSADHTYQQNIPLEAFSTEWFLTPTAWHDTSDYVRVTAGEDNCQIYRNGTLLNTLNRGQTYQFKLNGPANITTSQPAVLYQYMDGRYKSWGDVAMFAPNSAHQVSRYCTFPTFPLNNRPGYNAKYYVNIVVPTSETSLLLLDGSPLTDFQPISGTAYSYSRHPITQNNHTLFTSGSGFCAFTYGLAENWEAYAMGLGGIDTTTRITGNNHVTIDTGSCTGQLHWHDTLLLAPSTTHFTVSAPEGLCDSSYTIHLTTYPSYFDTIDSITCLDQLPWNDSLLSVPGTHTLSYQTIQGCDSIITLQLHKAPSYFDTIDSTACQQMMLWDDTLLSVPDTHILHYQTINGCDSTIMLHLSLSPLPEGSLDTGCCNDTLYIQQYALAVPGDYTITLSYTQGCDSIIHLHVDTLPHYYQFDTVYVNPDRGYLGPGGRQYWPGETFEDSLFTQMGCDSIIRISVMPIIDSTCQYHVWTPNTFTPLLGSNNRFRVISDNITHMTVSIFHRWGDWVCTFDGLTEGWDGTKNGTPCPAGTYVYLIRFATPCQSNVKPIVGTITLLR